MTRTARSAPASRPGRDVLDVDPRELRDTIRITIDRELVDELDRRRGGISRSQYAEQVLTAALEREHPHRPDGWTPERAAERRFPRLQRYLLPPDRPLNSGHGEGPGQTAGPSRRVSRTAPTRRVRSAACSAVSSRRPR